MHLLQVPEVQVPNNSINECSDSSYSPSLPTGSQCLINVSHSVQLLQLLIIPVEVTAWLALAYTLRRTDVLL